MFFKENKNAPLFAFIFRILGFFMGLSTLVIQVVANNYASDEYFVNHLWAFFTVHTNIFATLLFLFLIIKTIVFWVKDKKLSVISIHPLLHLGTCFYTFITMTVYWLALAPGLTNSSQQLTLWNNLFVHLFTPLITIFDSLLFAKHGKLSKYDAVKWLAYPILYFIILSIFAQFTSLPYYEYVIGDNVFELMYPYPFLDPNVMGGWGLTLSLLIILSLFLALGMLFIKIDGKIEKRIEKKKVIEL